MADMTELKNIVRLGTVQSVNASKMTARVKFKDKGGITSGDLRIIKRPVYVVRTRNAYNLPRLCSKENIIIYSFSIWICKT